MIYGAIQWIRTQMGIPAQFRSLHLSAAFLLTKRVSQQEGPNVVDANVHWLHASTKESKMRAAWYERNGSAHDVLVVGELPTPVPGPGEVLVRLHSSGVNPSDVKARQRRPLQADRIVPHSDGGGVIQAVGSGVSDRRIGQRVWIWNGQWKRAMGTACECIALPESQAVELPDEADFQIAACLGIPALTALHAIRMAGHIEGTSILVTGAGNAVGHYVVQLARQRGAMVIGTAGSDGRKTHALRAGVSHLIDYKRESVADKVKEITQGAGVQLVIDMDFSTTAALIGKGALMLSRMGPMPWGPPLLISGRCSGSLWRSGRFWCTTLSKKTGPGSSASSMICYVPIS
jgi:NADPH:quinone reductase